jgi:hypothetical protein
MHIMLVPRREPGSSIPSQIQAASDAQASSTEFVLGIPEEARTLEFVSSDDILEQLRSGLAEA